MVAVVGGYFAAADGDDRAEAPSTDEILNSFGLSDAIIDEYLPVPHPAVARAVCIMLGACLQAFWIIKLCSGC